MSNALLYEFHPIARQAPLIPSLRTMLTKQETTNTLMEVTARNSYSWPYRPYRVHASSASLCDWWWPLLLENGVAAIK